MIANMKKHILILFIASVGFASVLMGEQLNESELCEIEILNGKHSESNKCNFINDSILVELIENHSEQDCNIYISFNIGYQTLKIQSYLYTVTRECGTVQRDIYARTFFNGKRQSFDSLGISTNLARLNCDKRLTPKSENFALIYNSILIPRHGVDPILDLEMEDKPLSEGYCEIPILDE